MTTSIQLHHGARNEHVSIHREAQECEIEECGGGDTPLSLQTS